MSRWLVGSSSTSRSACWTSAAARATRRRSPPDSRPNNESSPSSASPSPASTSRIALSPAHSCTAASPTTRSRIDDSSAASARWDDRGDLDAAGARHASGVGLLAADDQAQQGRLATAVTADHADAFALADADRDAVQDRRRAVGLADRLEVDQVGRHQRLVNARPERPEPVRRRRGTRGTDRTRRVRGRSAARPPRPRPGTRWWAPSRRRSRPARRGRDRRPGSGAGSGAATARRPAGRWCSEWASAIVSPARSASSSPSAGCSVEGVAPALAVEFGVALGRRDAEVGEGERPPERPGRQDRCEHLAASGAQRRAADQAEARRRCPASRPAGRARRARCRCATARRRRRRAAAASAEPPAMPPATGIALVISRRACGRDLRVFGEQRRRPPGQVAVIGRDRARTPGRSPRSRGRAGPGDDLVVQVDGLEDGAQLVKAVGASRARRPDAG